MARRIIANEREIQKTLTQIIRADTAADQRPPTYAERLKAIDLLGRTTGLWSPAPKPPEYTHVEFVGDELLED